MPIEIGQLVGAIAKIATPIAVNKLQRNEEVIKLLKQFGLDPEYPPADFRGVYAYALVEYGMQEHPLMKEQQDPLREGAEQEIEKAVKDHYLMLEFLQHEEIRKVLRTPLEKDNPLLLQAEGESCIRDFAAADKVRAAEIDYKLGLLRFSAIFLAVACKTRKPEAALRDQNIEYLQEDLKVIWARLETLPTLEAKLTEITQLLAKEGPLEAQCRAYGLAQQMREWFKTLDFKFESYETWKADYFEWIITYRVRRQFNRVLIRGVDGEGGVADVKALAQAVKDQQTHEGWLVSSRRMSKAARDWVTQAENVHLACYTFDELLDQDADFSGYLSWLEEEILRRKINEQYVPLACTKEEYSPETQQQIASNFYGKADGWIDGYVDVWLDDPAKEHISVLGEFGTGKTWFTLHYAWKALQAYQKAKQKGTERPRLPLVIPLRDYAKAVSVESLFSEFFFRKYEIPLPGYSAFEQLNRMGKLLLIFDGFDEMAARVDRQQMINNFWELAKVVVPGSKAILTCRTEHFPEAKEGRNLLGAELKASTAALTGEPPQFEVLELEKFNEDQIRQVLSFRADERAVQQIMGYPQLLDLARRPVMTELILEALPEITAGKPSDLARVYLYAVRRKMERDIRADRTFTSLADKLYFLCELSWEMILSNQMRLNYKLFPERIRQLFGSVVQEQTDLDHWHYDMMGQSMLIRDAEGNYSPAHRSLLEFFVAYKLVAMLGVLESDFLEVAREQTHVDQALPAQEYGWWDYYQRQVSESGAIQQIAPLIRFSSQDTENLQPLLVRAPLAKAILDLAVPMLDSALMVERLLPQIQATRQQTQEQAGYWGGNLAQLLVDRNPWALETHDLSDTHLKGVTFADVSLLRVNLARARLADSCFNKVLMGINTIAVSPDGHQWAIGESNGRLQMWDALTGRVLWIRHESYGAIQSVVFSPDGQWIVSGGYDQTLRLWDIQGNAIGAPWRGHISPVFSVAFSPDGQRIVSGSYDQTLRLWDIQGNPISKPWTGHTDSVFSVAFSPDGQRIISGSDDQTIRLWDAQGKPIGEPWKGHTSFVRSVAFSPDGQRIISGSSDHTLRLWDIQGKPIGEPWRGHTSSVRSVAFSPDGQRVISGSYDQTIRLWDAQGNPIGEPWKGHTDYVRSVAFSPDGQRIISGSYDQTIRLWDAQGNPIGEPWKGHTDYVRSVAFSPDGQRIISISDDQTIRLWDVQGNLIGKPWRGHTSFVRSVAFSPDGLKIVSGSSDHTLRLWDAQGNPITEPWRGHTNSVFAVAFSPNGQRVISGGFDHTLRLWDNQGNPIGQPWRGHTSHILSVAFSPDGQHIISGSDDQTLRLWDTQGNPIDKPWRGHTSAVFSVAFSPDGQKIISGSSDHTLRLWDTQGNPIDKPWRGHTDFVQSVAFSPDGQKIVSGSSDQTIRLWNIQGKAIGEPWRGHTDSILSVAFSPDGQKIVSGSYDQTFRLWQVDTSKCLAVVQTGLCGGLDFSGALGLTEAQKIALEAMGAYCND
ncbi:NACHT domain-containing protein [Acaryochloris sp. 'Moss Beach']|uniref:NACHT domain-containing protein n=1 Tax=Acaryochloris sp. 'Moss Beach' TaxID=2740837 RepID=UPI001F264796|nr:NACHT domain-containing protein [Acaryochloris sp. 'Moss Beach']UJB70379.1 NACHT domain-containing protein [Acaryochloris sp. 'Moss Beach']